MMQSPTREPNGANLGSMAARSPEGSMKGWIRNMALYLEDQTDFNDTLQFWFRPIPISQELSVQYDKMRVMGQSHQYMTYSHTNNATWSFEIRFNALMILKEIARGRSRQSSEGSLSDMKTIAQMIEEDRRFLEALHYPEESPEGQIGSSPPSCILSIPGFVTARCRITNLRIQLTDNFIFGGIKDMSCRATFEEAPLQRITMRDHLTNGNFRTWE